MKHWKATFFALLVPMLLSAAAPAATQAGATPPSASLEPIVTIGGPSDSLSHTRVALSDEQYGLYASLTPAVVTARLGEPARVSLWVANGTDERQIVCVGPFRDVLHFNVVDSGGAALPSRIPSSSETLSLRDRCVLDPSRQWRWLVPLRLFVPIMRPGRYTVSAVLDVHVPYATVHKIRTNSITLNIIAP